MTSWRRARPGEEKHDIMPRPAGQIPILCHGMHIGLQKSPDMLMKLEEFMIFRIPGGSFWRVESMSLAGRTVGNDYDIMPACLAAAKGNDNIMGRGRPAEKKS